MWRFILSILLLAPAASATIIQSSNRIDWIPGHTVGVRGGIPNDSGWATVNIPVTDDAGIEAAMSGAAAGPTIFQLESGVYNCTNGLSITRSYSKLRGVGSNTVLWGSVNIGIDSLGDTWFNITNGGWKGETNFVVDNKTALFGDDLVAGDSLIITAEFNRTNEVFPVISVAGFGGMLQQIAHIHAINGMTVSITAPLIFNFTNSGRCKGLNDAQLGTNSYQIFKFGLEHLKVTTNNAGIADPTPGLVNQCNGYAMVDCWATNVWFQEGPNYQVNWNKSVHCEMTHCWIGPATGAGTSHAGFHHSQVGSSYFYNNIYADVPQLGVMFNDGCSGNAYVYNFFTNNTQNGDVLMHNTHPLMNLWEGNYWPVKFVMDGYFGSSSHQTVFRNYHPGSMAMKRWTSYMQVLGNVCYDGTYNFCCYLQPTNHFACFPVFDVGFPNIGNPDYETMCPPTSLLWPGNRYKDFAGFYTTNGYTSLTQATALTNIIYGNFTNFYEANMGNQPIRFQDPNNTNVYYPQDDPGLFPASAGTSTSMTMNRSIWVTNGWVVYRAGQVAYQMYSSNQFLTHNLHGNRTYINSTEAVIWDAGNADHSLPTSLIYNTKPGWMLTNRFPAIDPETPPYVTPIPAQDRYYGFEAAGGGGGGGSPTGPGRGQKLKHIKLR